MPPRSPSRDHSDRYTGIRDYFQTPDWLRRWKAWAVVCGCVLTGLWLVVEAVHPQAASFHTHGELANPHAAWDNDCTACHRSHGLGELSVGSIYEARDRWHDLTCTKCHAGPAHHTKVKGSDFHDRCSNCHHDHAGRTTSLTRISDEHCTHCHGQLSEHTMGTAPYSESIKSFTRGHPEFAVLREFGPTKDQPARPYDVRRLKFSHALHMSPGMVLEPVSADKKGKDEDHTWTLEKIKRLYDTSDPKVGESAADRYRSRNTPDGIALTCADCHQLDAGYPNPDPMALDETRAGFDRLSNALRTEPRQAVLPPRAAGAYYLPVNFEAHCQACHPLRAPDGVSEAGAERRIKLDGFPIPHRTQPADLKTFIAGKYAGHLAGKNPDLARPIGPGERLDPPPAGGRLDPNSAAVATFRGEVDRLTDTALRTLLLNAVPAEAIVPKVAPKPNQVGVMPRELHGGYACGKCHFTTDKWTKPVDARIATLPGHTVWFAHATFNHVSHRGLVCASCHPNTGKPDPPPQEVYEREPVAILGIDSCRACHAPIGTKVTTTDGLTVSAAGIRHNCTDCHRYHNTDRPLQGLGAPARDPAHLRPLNEFLGGSK